MTCYHPCAIEKLKPTHSNYNPKHKIRFLGPVENILDLDVYNTAVSDIEIVPCGHCIGCRIDKARDWAVRIFCESETTPERSWFLTLTYDDFHMSDISLDKKDFQKFIKDLRNYLYYKNGSSIRYFGCGEYGDKSGRKHFHIIVFGLGDLDIKPRTANNGYIYYQSDILNQIWDKGFVVVAELNINTASYVARYTLKKQGLKKYENLDVQAPFLLMSTRPGIGYDYVLSHQNSLMLYNFIFCDHAYYPLPRYFKKVLVDELGYDFKLIDEDKKAKYYNINLTKEIYSHKDLNRILEAEEIKIESQNYRRKL